MRSACSRLAHAGGPVVAQATRMSTSIRPGAGDADADENSIEQKVIEIVVEHAHVDRSQVARDSRLFDLTDSLGVTEIVMALEDEFESSIPDEDACNIHTVGDLLDYVKSHFPAPREKDATGP